jgi:hypothetical protein
MAATERYFIIGEQGKLIHKKHLKSTLVGAQHRAERTPQQLTPFKK